MINKLDVRLLVQRNYNTSITLWQDKSQLHNSVVRSYVELASTDLDLLSEPLPLRYLLREPEFLALEEAASHFTLTIDSCIYHTSHIVGTPPF